MGRSKAYGRRKPRRRVRAGQKTLMRPPYRVRVPKPLTQREEKELKRKNMKNLINLFIDDIKNENLSRQEIIKYGVIAPLVFYILFLIEQIINAL